MQKKSFEIYKVGLNKPFVQLRKMDLSRQGCSCQVLSQGTFQKWKLSDWAISQAVTSQGCPSRSAQPFTCSSRSVRPPNPSQPLGKLSLGKSLLEKCLWVIAQTQVENSMKSMATNIHFQINIFLGVKIQREKLLDPPPLQCENKIKIAQKNELVDLPVLPS